MPPLVVSKPVRVVAPVTPKVVLKLPAWATVKAPLTVVVTPDLEILTPVALVVPRFRAAAASRLRAPTVVLKLEAAFPVREIAPPLAVRPPLRVVRPLLIVSPALPVMRELKVLAPAKVWAPVLTNPGKEASAFCRNNVLPAITAPSELLGWESIVPIFVTPELLLPVVNATHELPFHIYVADDPGDNVTLPTLKLALPTLFR
jgi:hypothetical protein